MHIRFSALISIIMAASVAMQAQAADNAAAQAEEQQFVAGSYQALRPGLWEIRTATRMQGMPDELPPVPYTAVQCLAQELLDNQENLSAITATQGTCEIHDVAVTETRTNWDMTCHQHGMEFAANGTITPITRETYTGNVYFTMKNATISAIKGVVNVQGMWQGECTGAQKEHQAQPTYRTPVIIR